MVTVAVDAGIGSVCDLGVVRAVCTGWVVVASRAVAGVGANASSRADTSMSTGRTNAASVGTGVSSGVSAGVGTGRANATGVSAGRAKAAGVASRADTSCAGGANTGASTAVVGIGVDTRVDCVTDAAVRAMCSGGVIIASHVAASVCAGMAGAADTSCASVASAANTGCAGVGASSANTSASSGAAVVSIRVNTGVDGIAHTSVRTVCSSGVIVTGHIAASVCASVAGAAEASCAGCSMSTGGTVSASSASGGAVKDVRYWTVAS